MSSRTALFAAAVIVIVGWFAVPVAMAAYALGWWRP